MYTRGVEGSRTEDEERASFGALLIRPPFLMPAHLCLLFPSFPLRTRTDEISFFFCKSTGSFLRSSCSSCSSATTSSSPPVQLFSSSSWSRKCELSLSLSRLLSFPFPSRSTSSPSPSCFPSLAVLLLSTTTDSGTLSATLLLSPRYVLSAPSCLRFPFDSRSFAS